MSVAGRRWSSGSSACSPISRPTRLIIEPPISAAVSSPTTPLAVFTTTMAPFRIQSDGSIVERGWPTIDLAILLPANREIFVWSYERHHDLDLQPGELLVSTLCAPAYDD